MMEPDRTLLILNEIRAELRALNARMTFEFSEIHDRLRRIDERIDGFVTRVEVLERRP
jgi:hypothetical protein